MQNPLDRLKNPSDKIAALALLVSVIGTVAALIVSSVGTVIAWNTSSRDQEFRRLSSMPKLSVNFVDGSDKERTGIVLRNVGLGPARVVNLQVYVAGKLVAEMPDNKGWETAIAAVKKARPEIKLDVPVRFTSFYGDFNLPVGESQALFYQNNPEVTAASRSFLKASGDVMQFGICMCSIYEQCWNVRSPMLPEQPCNDVAKYLLRNTGPLAKALQDVPRVVTPWDPGSP